MRKLAAKLSVVTLALAALASLVIHASCSRGAPSAGPEPQAAPQKATSVSATPATAQAPPAATAAESEPDDEPSNVYMGASKAGPMVRPHRSKKTPQQQAPSPANGNQGKP